MRVLHVHSGNLYGGVETMLAALAVGAKQVPSLTMEFAYCFEGKSADELRTLGYKVHKLGGVRTRYPWTGWVANRRLRQLLKGSPDAGPYDMAICQSTWALAQFGKSIQHSSSPLGFWLHDPPSLEPNYLETRAAGFQPDLIVCNSRYTRQSASRLHPDRKSVV